MLAYRFRKALLFRFVAEQGGRGPGRGEVESFKGCVPQPAPLRFERIFVKKESRIAPQKTP